MIKDTLIAIGTIILGVIGTFLLVGLMVGILILLIGWWGIGDNSQGERIGTIVKFSHKGIIWQTWEGEANVGSMISDGEGMSPYVFDFSICDNNLDTIEKIQGLIGKRAKIQYSSPILYFGWIQKSAYCVKSIEVIE